MPNCGGSDVKTTESRKKDMHRLQKQKTVTFVTSLKPDFLTDKNTFCVSSSQMLVQLIFFPLTNHTKRTYILSEGQAGFAYEQGQHSVP